jgi:signal transduction histidine kinase
VLALERLVGLRSSKPSFYAAWREKSARLDRTIETLERISTALCSTPDGPGALCEAVVEAAGHHFNARWAAMGFSNGVDSRELPRVIVRAGGGIARDPAEPPAAFTALATRTLAAEGPVLVEPEAGGAVAVPMPVRGELAGVLAVGLPEGADVQSSDLSILVTLANHAGVALHHAWYLQELEGTRRRLEAAGRRQLLSQERNRIARELHDSVAQQLLTIGMNLEWCRRQESLSSPVLERVVASKALARSSVDEIRAAIFELASDGQIELRPALREVVEDLRAGTRLGVALRTSGRQRVLPSGVHHAILQIAREALFNVVRHADATRASVTLRWRPESVCLVVADDGCGDPKRLQRLLLAPRPSGQHLGLTGIAERVRGCGGTATFGRRRGGGVSLKVEIPLGGTAGCA